MKPPRLSKTQRAVLRALADDPEAYIGSWSDGGAGGFLLSQNKSGNLRGSLFLVLFRNGYIRKTGQKFPYSLYKLTDAGALALGEKVQA